MGLVRYRTNTTLDGNGVDVTMVPYVPSVTYNLLVVL
jgi:hypothetical protein